MSVNAIKSAANLLASPFDLANKSAYENWRAFKLEQRVTDVATSIVCIADVDEPTEVELTQIKQQILINNFALYQLKQTDASKASIRQFARRIGLDQIDNNICSDEDSISSVQVSTELQKKLYIPYTNRPLSWHADGYYNPLDQQIRGMMLHCVRPASSGGENMFLDHEMLYIQLRDQNPDYIKALMHPQAMTIPANNEGADGEQIRPAQSGPVFSLEKGSGNLHMRYSARTRNIIWRDDAITQQAKAVITEILSNSPYISRYMMAAGQGVICNNVLHNRTAFEDNGRQNRLLYRARFYDRVAETDISRVLTMVSENVTSQ